MAMPHIARAAGAMTLAMRRDGVPIRSLEDLEEWVKEYFTEIENKDVEVPYLGDPMPFGSQNLGKIVRYVPVKD